MFRLAKGSADDSKVEEKPEEEKTEENKVNKSLSVLSFFIYLGIGRGGDKA